MCGRAPGSAPTVSDARVGRWSPCCSIAPISSPGTRPMSATCARRSMPQGAMLWRSGRTRCDVTVTVRSRRWSCAVNSASTRSSPPHERAATRSTTVPRGRCRCSTSSASRSSSRRRRAVRRRSGSTTKPGCRRSTSRPVWRSPSSTVGSSARPTPSRKWWKTAQPVSRSSQPARSPNVPSAWRRWRSVTPVSAARPTPSGASWSCCRRTRRSVHDSATPSVSTRLRRRSSCSGRCVTSAI